MKVNSTASPYRKSRTSEKHNSELSMFGLSLARTAFTALRTGFATLPESSVFARGYKMKTHKGANKRWTALPNGGFKRKHAGHSHLNIGLSTSHLSRLTRIAYAKGKGKGDQKKRLRKLMPGNRAR
ncbi:hypothetical protein G7K_0730-t1 [Saitoella complicata NRRL Y-17804]|uniref:50S ribosomal protein L35 n=1 Tax=Saitoella complicata (strain BCRC 22490 / CBS 7301 / JCM 7358 / NBRC 10748 / NRRL Y-17804) TaxID=698492 RepID=A0A0E9NAR4_SAICN|nr:hypothetical protein G7K_0730-t1 [Saitoella complicata NRRL Y-17804]